MIREPGPEVMQKIPLVAGKGREKITTVPKTKVSVQLPRTSPPHSRRDSIHTALSTDLVVSHNVGASGSALVVDVALRSIRLLIKYTLFEWEGLKSDDPQTILDIFLRSSMMVKPYSLIF